MSRGVGGVVSCLGIRGCFNGGRGGRREEGEGVSNLNPAL